MKNSFVPRFLYLKEPVVYAVIKSNIIDGVTFKNIYFKVEEKSHLCIIMFSKAPADKI